MDKELNALDYFLRSRIYNNHRDINAGGCCVFAALLAKELKKVKDMKVRVRVTDWYSDKDAILKARKKVRSNTVKEWNKHGVGFNHVALEITYKGTTYHADAKGIRGRAHFQFLNGELTLKEATDLGNTARGWNHWFNRREIPAIKRRVREYFKKHLKKTAKSVVLVA